MSRLTDEILRAASGLAEGEVILPKEFLHLGTRAAIDQALSRLAREGKLLRIMRGAYVAPLTGRFGPRPPAVEKVVRSFAAKNGEVIAESGAAAANALGLTTQVPVREVFVTTGPTRRFRLGNRTIELRRAPSWQLALGKSAAGSAARALDWLGPAHAREGLATLHHRLPPGEWRSLVAARAALPTWMARMIGEASIAGIPRG